MDNEEKNEKAKLDTKSIKKKLTIGCIVFIVFSITGLGVTTFSRYKLYEELKAVELTNKEGIEKISRSADNLIYSDIYDKYETACLGNKGFFLINYGLVAENIYGYVTINENNESVLNVDGNETIIATTPISYINILENTVVYRDYSDKKVYIVSSDGTNKKILINDKVGPIIVVNNNDVYFVSYSSGNELYKYDIKNNKTDLILQDNIKTFTVVGDKILYLDNNNTLHLRKINGREYWSQENVDKFYFNGRIYIQNNDSVISFDINKHFAKEVTSGITELLGVDETNLYYTYKDKLYSHNIEENNKTRLDFGYEYYKGVFNINGNIIVIGGEINEDLKD